MSTPPTTTPPASPRRLAAPWWACLIGGVVVGVALLLVLLSTHDPETRSAELLIGIPLITGLLAGAGVSIGVTAVRNDLAGHTETLAQINSQTNGVLDQRIYNGARTAVADVFGDLFGQAGITAPIPLTPPPAPVPSPVAGGPATPDASTHGPGV